MKVLMIDSLIGNDYTICLCSGLSSAGLDIRLVTPENKVIKVPVNFIIERWSPVKNGTYGKTQKLFKYAKYLMRVLIFIMEKKVNIVHYQFFRRKSESIFFLLLRLLGVNLVYTAHNVLPHENSKIDYLLKLIVYRATKIIIVHSGYVKNKLINNFKIKSEKIKIIPHGNFDIYLPQKSISKIEAIRSLNLSEKDHVLLFFGFIRQYKGLDLLLDAFEFAVKKDKRLKLVIAGAPQSQDLEDHYRKKIAASASNDKILFHARFIPSEEVATYFVASDVLVLPYRKIDHSGVAHLGYSFGKSLIATKVGDFKEIIEDGKSGFLLETNDVECLANTIVKAFYNTNKLESMGRYARNLNEIKYSWDVISKKCLKVYKALENISILL